MVHQERWQLQGNAPQIYEEQKVPALFRPLAKLTLQHVDIHEGDRIIDVACGTGILGRLAAERIGKLGSVVGIDLNAGMIEVAKQFSPATEADVGWREGDVVALPFSDSSFDIAFCQQGFQFFPDKVSALKEIRRVLVPGGSIVMTIWSSVYPYAAAAHKALLRYVSAESASSSLAPFEFTDSEVIMALMVEGGFQDIEIDELVIDRTFGPAEESIPREIIGTPFGPEVESLEPSLQEALFAEIIEALDVYRTPSGFTIPMDTYLIRAKSL